MNLSRTLFGMSPPHIQPLTPVSEVSEPPESPSPYPYLDGILETREQVKSNHWFFTFISCFECFDDFQNTI